MGKYAPGVVVDCQTNTETFVELTAEEEAQRDLDIIEAIRLQEQRDIEAAELAALKESARTKLIAGKPLTPEEAATIVL